MVQLNINQNINKLLFALQKKGCLYKVNSYQFYSEKKDSYVTKYILYKKELVEEFDLTTHKITYTEKYVEKANFYNKTKMMKYLADEYKEVNRDGI